MIRQKLNYFEIKFCQEYLLDFNGTRAYERAKGDTKETKNRNSAGVLASRLLARKDIQEKLRELLKGPTKEYEINLDRLLKELSTIAYSDIINFLEKDPETGSWIIKELEELPRHLTPAIKKLTCTYTDKGYKQTIEMHSKEGALDLLSKYAGLASELRVALHTLRKYGYLMPIEGGYKFVFDEPSEAEAIEELAETKEINNE